MCSPALTALFRLHSPFTKRSLPFTKHSPCVHKAFTLRSPFIQRSLIFQSDNIIVGYNTYTCSIFVIFPDYQTQCKSTSQGSPNKLFILYSHSTHILFTVHSLFTLCSHLCSICALRSLTVHLSLQVFIEFRSGCAHRLVSVRTRSHTIQVGKWYISWTLLLKVEM